MKAKNLEEFNSSPAPKEWKEIEEIKMGKPKYIIGEISLQKLDGLNICYWTISKYGGYWDRESDYFYVRK
jgi:hypothetical protein